jgi:hypothetical protein
MSFAQGTVNKSFVSAVDFLDRREIFEKLVDITNEKASFALMMMWMGRYVKTDMTNYHNFVNTELFAVETISDAAVTVHTANTEITVRVASANGTSYPRVGNIVQIPGANRRTALVVDRTADATGDLLRLKSVSGSALELANAQKISVVGSAGGEGGKFISPLKFLPVKRQNNIQIFPETIAKITDIQKAAKVEIDLGDGSYQYLYKAEADGLLVMKKNISNHMLFGEGSGDNFITTSPTLTDPDGNAISTTRGLNSYVASEGINITQTAIGSAMFEALKRELDKRRCGNLYHVWGGSEMEIQWDTFFQALGTADLSSAARWNITGKDLELGISKVTYFGRTYAKMGMAAFNEANITNFTGSAGYNKFMFFIPNDEVALEGGGSAPRIRVRYMEVPTGGMNSSSNGIYRTTQTGNYAPVPTNDERQLSIHCETKQGLEFLGADHAARAILA